MKSGRLLTISEYAEQLGVRTTWVRDKVTARTIQHSRLGRHVRFSQADHEANLKDWATPSARPTTADLLQARARRGVA